MFFISLLHFQIDVRFRNLLYIDFAFVFWIFSLVFQICWFFLSFFIYSCFRVSCYAFGFVVVPFGLLSPSWICCCASGFVVVFSVFRWSLLPLQATVSNPWSLSFSCPSVHLHLNPCLFVLQSHTHTHTKRLWFIDDCVQETRRKREKRQQEIHCKLNCLCLNHPAPKIQILS